MIEIYTNVYIHVNKYIGINIIFLSNAPVSLLFSASLTGESSLESAAVLYP